MRLLLLLALPVIFADTVDYMFAVQQVTSFTFSKISRKTAYINCDIKAVKKANAPLLLFLRFEKNSSCFRQLRKLNYFMRQGSDSNIVREVVAQELYSCDVPYLKTIVIQGSTLTYMFQCAGPQKPPPRAKLPYWPMIALAVFLLMILLLFVVFNWIAMQRYFSVTVTVADPNQESTPPRVSTPPAFFEYHMPGWRSDVTSPTQSTQSPVPDEGAVPAAVALDADGKPIKFPTQPTQSDASSPDESPQPNEQQQLVIASQVSVASSAASSSQTPSSDYHTEPLLAISEIPALSSKGTPDDSDIIVPSIQQEG